MAEIRTVTATPPLALKEVFLRGRWREAIVLTYSFDLPFFESYMLPILVRNGCRSIAVAACNAWLPDRLRRWSEAGDIREAGESYTLSSVAVRGVFHAKLVLAAGEDGGIALIGSGNISAHGMATGGELFTLVEWNGADAPPLAREAWQVCRSLARHLPVDRAFVDRVEALGRLVPALVAPVEQPVLLHDLDRPILDQFLDIVPDGQVEEVIVWSPFTDRPLTALRELVERTGPARLIVAVQPALTNLDGERLSQLQADFPLVAWEVRALQPARPLPPGLIHAKGLLVTLRTGDQLALVGSPNLSTPALLRTADTGNFELAVVHRGPDLWRGLFGEGGVISLGEPVETHGLTWEPEPTTAEPEPSAADLHLVGARHDGQWLAVEILGPPPSAIAILLDGVSSLPLARVNDGWGAALPEGLTPRTAELVWPAGRSGPVVVANLPRLAAMHRAAEPRHHTPLEVLDYGADNDILALLDQIAELAVVSVYDLDRMLRGRGAPTPEEEVVEFGEDAPVVRLEDIDFERVRQHPRAHAYDRGSGAGFDTPRIVLWLDEVVGQFDGLRQRQLHSLAAPSADEAREEEESVGDVPERHQWSTSRRVALLVRNRLRRGVAGMSDPRFWRLVEPDWMTMNYALWLGLLERLWVRASTARPILTSEDLAPITTSLLAGFWGDDRRTGYFSQQAEDARLSSAVLLADHQADALTAAACIRLLDPTSPSAPETPFVVGTVVRVAEPLGLVNEEVVERALVFLDRAEDPPSRYVERLRATLDRFSWDRFAANLAWRYRLKSAAVVHALPALGRFSAGDVLAIESNDDSALTLAAEIFRDWVAVVRKHDPDRKVIHMAWGGDLILIYDVSAGEVWARRAHGTARLVAAEVGPEAIGQLALSSSLDATA